MKTLFLNPPSFEGFDGGVGSRWPASREITVHVFDIKIVIVLYKVLTGHP